MAHFSPENFQTCAIGMLLGRAAILKDRILDWHLESEGVTAAQFKVLIIVTQYQVDTPVEHAGHRTAVQAQVAAQLGRGIHLIVGDDDQHLELRGSDAL